MADPSKITLHIDAGAAEALIARAYEQVKTHGGTMREIMATVERIGDLDEFGDVPHLYALACSYLDPYTATVKPHELTGEERAKYVELERTAGIRAAAVLMVALAKLADARERNAMRAMHDQAAATRTNKLDELTAAVTGQGVYALAPTFNEVEPADETDAQATIKIHRPALEHNVFTYVAAGAIFAGLKGRGELVSGPHLAFDETTGEAIGMYGTVKSLDGEARLYLQLAREARYRRPRDNDQA